MRYSRSGRHSPAWSGFACHVPAGFIGSDEFHLWRSGVLVALNTFGAMLLALLALPAVLQYVHEAGSNSDAAVPAAGRRRASGTAVAARAAQAAADALRQAVLVAGLVRALAGFCAMLSAGVQRRHLYAWALFAPRFVFEACFLLLTDTALLLVSALV